MNNWKEEICIFIAWRKSALDYSQHHQRQILNDYNFACYRIHFNFVITCGISLWHLSSKLHVVLNKSIEIADFYFWVFLSHFAVCIKFIAQCFFSILLNNSIHYCTQFFYFLWQINCNLWRGQNCYYSIYFQSDHSHFSLFFIMEKGLMKWGIKGPQFPLTSSFHVFVKEKKNVIIALELQTRVYEKLLLHPQKNRKNPF